MKYSEYELSIHNLHFIRNRKNYVIDMIYYGKIHATSRTWYHTTINKRKHCFQCSHCVLKYKIIKKIRKIIIKPFQCQNLVKPSCCQPWCLFNCESSICLTPLHCISWAEIFLAKTAFYLSKQHIFLQSEVLILRALL